MSDLASDPVITFLAEEGLSAELLRVHVDDGTGHCAGCRWQQRARPVHPCPIRCYAEGACVYRAPADGGVPPRGVGAAR